MMKEIVFKVHEECRLDSFLRANLPGKLPDEQKMEISNSKLRRLVVAGKVSVNGRQIRVPGYTLLKGSSITVAVDIDKLFFEKQNDDIKFELTSDSVIYEDDYILVVNKPCHFPVESTIVESRDNLHQAVIRYLHSKNPELKNPPYAGIMHRLDRDTSGVILFSKQRTVNGALHDMFDSSMLENGGERQISKIYRAVCCLPHALEDSGKASMFLKRSAHEKHEGLSTGLPSDFNVENHLGRVSAKSAGCRWGSVSPSDGGKYALTEFHVAGQNGGLLYVDAHPVTGRTHQIRVHISQKGFPILGDVLYGGRESERIHLHAYCLKIKHPADGRPLCFTAPLPDGFGPELEM